MNRLQLRIISIGAIAFAAMGAYPPWVLTVPSSTIYLDGHPSIQYPAQHKRSYGFVFSPPEANDWLPRIPPAGNDAKGWEERALFPHTDFWSVGAQTVSVDWSRLVLQWASLVMLVIAACVVATAPRNTPEPTRK